ncbi:MAG: NAD-dependent epimerase/dehydratase family protein [Elusimicrobiota bacterium]
MRALVTGGTGFLGGAIASRLMKEGWTVRSLARGAAPGLQALGVDVVRADLSDAKAVKAACSGCEVVFHAAAKVGLWGSYKEFYEANVVGTKNVLAGCQDTGVGKLVFTGSPSVVFQGKDVEGSDESLPYPEEFDSYYSRTKALSEEMVLTARSGTLATVSLRPHLIWGPGTNHIVSQILDRARSGKLKRIGELNKKVDTTYIDDAVEAHWLAAERLRPGSVVDGKAYFISQGDPRPLWEIVDKILEAGGMPPVTAVISPRKAMLGAAVIEGLYRLLRIKQEPPVTTFMVKQLSTAHWFDIGAARRDLDYKPSVTIEEGMERLRRWLAVSKPS